jgi:hypothetical protein
VSVRSISERYELVIDEVERMLERQVCMSACLCAHDTHATHQVITALGKVVLPVDFDKYMQFHAQQKLFAPAYVRGVCV